MKPFRILLTELKHFNKLTQHDLYIPLNLGYLASHLNRVFGKKVDVTLHLDPVDLLHTAIEDKPQVIGFSLYVWNTYLTKTMINIVRKSLGNDVIIIVGGPSVGSSLDEQKGLYSRLPNVDVFVHGEGEEGLGNAIATMLEGKDLRRCDPIPGVVFCRGEELIPGVQPDLLNLEDVESPFLNGMLDDFLKPPFKTLLLTTRGCPYKCTYCVLGRNRINVRKFPVEQIKHEIDYIAEKYADYPHIAFFLGDDNFGLLKSDLEIAEHINKTAKEKGYPLKIIFTGDKKFTEISKGVAYSTKYLRNKYNVALQSLNPDTLKAIKRKNVSDETLIEVIDWAKSNGLLAMTELIFGLPYETKESFTMLLERCIDLGFDIINIHTLILLVGSELNSQESRRDFKLKSQYRLLMSNYGLVDNVFTCESEEIVVSSHSFSFDDFVDTRYLNFMFYAVYRLQFHYMFFKELRHADIKITDFLTTFFRPDKNEKWPESYLKFLSDFKNNILGELYDTEEGLIKAMEEKYRKNGCETLPPTKLNVAYGTRLVYQESEWVPEVFQRILQKFKDQIYLDKYSETFDFLMNFYNYQIINAKKPFITPETFKSPYNIKEWIHAEPSTSIENYRLKNPNSIKFYLNSANQKIIKSFLCHQRALSGNEYYYAWVELNKMNRFYSYDYVSNF